MRSEGYCSWSSVCVCVCVCVCVTQHLTSRTSNRAIKKCTYSVAYNHQKYCGDFSETTEFKSYGVKHKRKSQYANYSGLPVISFSYSMYSEAPEGVQACILLRSKL